MPAGDNSRELLELNKKNRIGLENYNNKGCLMKIVEYNRNSDIIVEFQDEFKARVNATYQSFLNGKIKNPYLPTVYGVGITGNKYPAKINGVLTKEYDMWRHMLKRCFDKEYKDKFPTYQNSSCCKEWLLFENFYEWVRSQENFDNWVSEYRSAIDKDILVKGNKLYSPETCCLVPMNVNSLFTKKDFCRGNMPIGITERNGCYRVCCNNPFTGKQEKLGTYSTIEEAFQIYKKYKENIIKQVAQIEYNKGNITKQCYEAMMQYEVEITD